jgi:hypothetical protein
MHSVIIAQSRPISSGGPAVERRNHHQPAVVHRHPPGRGQTQALQAASKAHDNRLLPTEEERQAFFFHRRVKPPDDDDAGIAKGPRQAVCLQDKIARALDRAEQRNSLPREKCWVTSNGESLDPGGEELLLCQQLTNDELLHPLLAGANLLLPGGDGLLIGLAAGDQIDRLAAKRVDLLAEGLRISAENPEARLDLAPLLVSHIQLSMKRTPDLAAFLYMRGRPIGPDGLERSDTDECKVQGDREYDQQRGDRLPHRQRPSPSRLETRAR